MALYTTIKKNKRIEIYVKENSFKHKKIILKDIF